MIVNKYPDGTSYVDVSSINPEKQIVFRINDYEHLHHLEQFAEAYNCSFDERPDILIPNLLDSQADRRFGVNQSSGLKIICKRLNSMNANFQIFHPHNSEVVEALINNIEIIDNSEFISIILNDYFHMDSIPHPKRNINPHEDLILMSSDAGGFKPLMKLCDKLRWRGETYSASKSRKYKDGKSSLSQIVDRQDFGGKDILIVDDISVYGGTFKGLSKLLRERNCGKLYLAVSHMTVQNLGEDPVTNYFDKVFTTNSKFSKYYGRDDFEPKNLEIIKLF